jgi:hypothetical protein
MDRTHPVLHYLAVVRAARDFGLDAERLDSLTLRFSDAEALARAAADELLERA